MDPTQISCRVFSLLAFFSGRFFLASVLTVFFVNCRSALFYFIYHIFKCKRSCSITYCYFCDENKPNGSSDSCMLYYTA